MVKTEKNVIYPTILRKCNVKMNLNTFDALQQKYEFVLQNFHRLCRICADTKSLINILVVDETADAKPECYVYNAERNIEALLKENYFPFNPTEESGLPNFICEKCVDTLVRWHRFREVFAVTTNLLLKVKEQINSELMAIDENSLLEGSCTDNDKILKSAFEETATETECHYEIEFLQALPADATIDNVTIVKESNDSQDYDKIESEPGYLEENDDEIQCSSNSATDNDDRTQSMIKTAKRKNQIESLNKCIDDNPECRILKTKRDFNQCPVCGIIVKSKMKHHLMRHAVPGGRPFKCPECDRAYSFKRSLSDHIRQVHENIRHMCEICEREFVSRDVLRIHRKLHLDESYRCDICAQTFQQRVYLRKHMAMHEVKRFSCGECGKNFRYKELLKQHMRIHTGEKPFACTLCHKKFRTSSHLKQHHRTHTKVKLFKCKRCPAVEYACKKSLDRHNSLEHPTTKDAR
ncbi:zinc finger protein 888-like [Wyeomyia smithii]|uniref:zinc finger protein 888-like n=1 Tax=Wyeomyia smithii TaxID=174621 RepID=UPI002467ADDC|nr:zinc finger protein 888-like [Wyeomyia smithii]